MINKDLIIVVEGITLGI